MYGLFAQGLGTRTMVAVSPIAFIRIFRLLGRSIFCASFTKREGGASISPGLPHWERASHTPAEWHCILGATAW